MTKKWWFWVLLCIGILIQKPFADFTHGAISGMGINDYIGGDDGLNILEFFLLFVILSLYNKDREND